MNKKKIILMAVLLISFIALTNIILANYNNNQTNEYVIDSTYEISTDSNFFGQPENQSLVSMSDDYEGELLIKGFKKVSETDDLMLYVKERNFNIAIYDKHSGYIWYSVYPDYQKFMMSGTSKFFVESGVIIEYYNMDNILVDDSKSYLSGSKYNVEIEYDYDSLDDGIVAHLTFEDLAIQFDLHVSIEADKLTVRLPMDTLVEEDVEKTVLNLDGTTSTKVTQYRLKSVYVFPYFGSNNHEINGYSFIPDGSGALIRYTDNRSSTAYTKRLYGVDEGVNKFISNESTYYLQDELTASLPIFGVNHGYNQAAFLGVVTEGDAFTEIHSYPFGYNSYEMNTTFAKFIVRERYTIQTSTNESDTFQMINQVPYPTDYEIEYHFLNDTEASYSGMANKYRELLEIDNQVDDRTVNISLIGMDYKNGLLGKDYVEMTKYSDVIDIVNQLSDEEINDISIVYMAWNKGGYYDNSNLKPRVASNLGGKQDFIEMLDYLVSQDAQIALFSNPMISFNQNLGSSVVKKLTLSPFVTDDVISSKFKRTYFRNPSYISESILDYQDIYNDYGLNSFVFDSIGDNLFSYRFNSVNYYRNQAIEVLVNELSELEDQHIGLYEPNAYLWKYIDSYYDAPIESNKYAYISDSIPFVEQVLCGQVNLYSSYMNYVSDYNVFSLRLIEYGVRPSFLLTKESTHNLRYTNSEFIYTSEFDLWKTTIVDITERIDNALNQVSSSMIMNHRYIDYGIAEIVYSNGSIVYVNYTNTDYPVGSNIVQANSYEVIS